MLPTGGVHPYSRAWKFVDDPAEDAAFRDRLRQVSNNNVSFTVDRTGPSPVLRTSGWSHPLTVGQVWRRGTQGPSYVQVCDGLIFWECDQYGRAYSIDNLVVP